MSPLSVGWISFHASEKLEEWQRPDRSGLFKLTLSRVCSTRKMFCFCFILLLGSRWQIFPKEGQQADISGSVETLKSALIYIVYK